jgi:hypothetical protein
MEFGHGVTGSTMTVSVAAPMHVLFYCLTAKLRIRIGIRLSDCLMLKRVTHPGLSP